MFDFETALKKLDGASTLEELMDIVKNTSAAVDNPQGKSFILYSGRIEGEALIETMRKEFGTNSDFISVFHTDAGRLANDDKFRDKFCGCPLS